MTGAWNSCIFKSLATLLVLLKLREVGNSKIVHGRSAPKVITSQENLKVERRHSESVGATSLGTDIDYPKVGSHKGI